MNSSLKRRVSQLEKSQSGGIDHAAYLEDMIRRREAGEVFPKPTLDELKNQLAEVEAKQRLNIDDKRLITLLRRRIKWWL